MILGAILGMILWALQVPLMTAKAALIASHKVGKVARKAKDKASGATDKAEKAVAGGEKNAKGTDSKKKKPRTKLGKKLSGLKARFSRDDGKKKSKSKITSDSSNESEVTEVKTKTKKRLGMVRGVSYRALKASLTTAILVLRTLACLAPILGLLVTIVALSLILSLSSAVSYYGTNGEGANGSWGGVQNGYIGFQGSTTKIVLKDGRSILEFLASKDGTYGPLVSISGSYANEYTPGNQFSSLNASIVWYLDHVASYSNVLTNEEIYFDQPASANALDFWSNTLEYYPRRWYGQSVALAELNSYLSSYNSQASSHYDWTPTGDQTEADRPAMPTWNFSQPDKNKFKQDVDPKSPVKYEATVSVVTGKNWKTSSQKKTYYDYIIDDANLAGQRFVINSLYKKDFTKITEKSGSRIGTSTDTDGKEHLWYTGEVDGIAKAYGFSNNEGFLDFYTGALSKGSATIHFADIKGKTAEELKATPIMGWSVRILDSIDDLQYAGYGDILYSGNEFTLFLAYDNAQRRAFTWNWDNIRNSFPDYGNVSITGVKTANDSRNFYALLHYGGTSSCPVVDDIAAGVAIQISLGGGTTASVAALNMSGEQPLGSQSDYDTIATNGNSHSFARHPGAVIKKSNGRCYARCTALNKKYSYNEAHWLEDNVPTSGTSSWINTLADKNYQAFTGVYQYQEMEPISCARALMTFYMDMNFDYDNSNVTKDVNAQFPVVSYARADCSGFVDAYVNLMTGGNGWTDKDTGDLKDAVVAALANGGKQELKNGYYIQWVETAGWTGDEYKSVPIGSIYLRRGSESGHTGVYLGYKEIEGVTYTLQAGWGRRFCEFPVYKAQTGDKGGAVFWSGSGGNPYKWVGTIHAPNS